MSKQFVISREAWRAAAARGFTYQRPETISTLVVHHTVGKAPVTKRGAAKEMREIQRMHQQGRGYSDIGYNFVIDRAGRIWEGRGWVRVGAHTANHNTGTIGVSFMGNYEKLRLTKRQIRAYERLIELARVHGIRFQQIRGHKQMPDQATACPGRNIMRQLGL